jgi:hypothetical protein
LASSRARLAGVELALDLEEARSSREACSSSCSIPGLKRGDLGHAWDASKRVEAFISRRVMDSWVDPREPYRKRRSLLRAQYNALGKLNVAAIGRIADCKYQRGPAFNRQHPFVDILLSDITESAEALDTSELVRETPPPAFQRVSR